MLRQRIVTALVLVAVLLPALFANAGWPFALLTLALIGASGRSVVVPARLGPTADP